MRRVRKIDRLLMQSGLPQDAIADCARVTMTGRASVTVEGQYGVVELTGERIRLKTGDGVLLVSGCDLVLSVLSLEKAVITSERISSVAYT